MLNEQELFDTAKAYLSSIEERINTELIIGVDNTIKKTYGHIFFYNSKKYIETEEFKYALIGNAPFLVEKETGRVLVFGTSKDAEDYIKDYENGTFVPAEDGIWEP